MIIYTKHELYIIQIDFNKIEESSNPLQPSQIKKKSNSISTITFDIIGYINTTNYSPNFNDNTPTEICHALWIDSDKFITSGNKHLSMWRIVDSSSISSIVHNNNLDIMRQKFKFGKYKNNKDKNDRPMSARIANNNIQFATSPSLRKITYKLGTFANSCFVSMTLGDIERTKETLFVITTQGILCTFNVQGRYLQKWVNLRMDKAYYITVKSSLLICCGAPDKVKFEVIFDGVTLE